MALTITGCKATTNSITIFFSGAVDQTAGPTSAINPANYTVQDLGSTAFSSATPPPSAPAPFGSSAVTILLPPNSFNTGDWVVVAVSNVATATGVSPSASISTMTIAAVVDGRHALRIVNAVATPTNVIIYFSDPLDTGGANDPTNATYTVESQGPNSQLIPTKNPTYDAVNKAVVLQLPSPAPLARGQWVVVTVKGVSSGGVPIQNGGNNTFSTRVNGGDGNGDEHRKKAVREVTESVEDAVAYPLLTEQVSFPPSPGAAAATTVVGPGPAGGAALGQSAAKAVSDVLGWKANAADPKGFVGALTQAFTLTDVEGHTEAAWNPRTYAVQSDLGGVITGAQASLYTRAKDALDQSLPLLDGLYPLDPDADPEYVKALREMARSQMNEIVKELGTLGGPSVLRVNTYLQILLGQGPITFQPPTQVQFDPDQIEGTLGTLRDTYGIYFTNNPFSNSIEDEQDITNFRVVSDYMTSLLQSWISNGQFFVLGSTTQPAFFGTQLVLLSRQYSVIAETVNEVRFALDSVFIGPGERQTLLLQFAPGSNLPAMFLEDMLREIEDHATDEGPRLLQDGGRISVTNNILPIVRNYEELVKQSHKPTNLRSLPDGYRTVRVQRALDDLHDQLKALINLAIPVGQQVPPPLEEPELGLQVLNVSPNSASPNQVLPVTIMGTGFKSGATAIFSGTPPIIVGTVTFLSENLLVANVVTAGAGTYNVTVTNPDGTPPAVLPSGFTVGD